MSDFDYHRFRDELAGIWARAKGASIVARKTDAGTGSRWEVGGYADIVSQAIQRAERHRRRAEGIDKQIAREQAAASGRAPLVPGIPEARGAGEQTP